MALPSSIKGGSTRSGRQSSPEQRFLDRDLNWLEFNRRVLHEAEDGRTPLLERVNFLSIFTSNLDEFVMKRIYGLREQAHAGVSGRHPGRMTSKELLGELRSTMQALLGRQAEVYRGSILPALAAAGIHLLDWDDLTGEELREAAAVFEERVFPVLTPLAFDVAHPFPFISNLSTSLGLIIRDPANGEKSFARVKVPVTLPQWVELSTRGNGKTRRFVRLPDLISSHLDALFPGMEIVSKMPFRITRNVDVENDELEDVEDLLEAVEEELRQRRMECVVRLEHPAGPCSEILRILMQELDLDPEDVYEMPDLLEYKSLRKIAALPFPKLRYRPWQPKVPPPLAGEEQSIFSVIRSGDLLVHHPYDSFDQTVLRLVREAAEDRNVLAVKMTIYRTGSDSPFIPLLIRAAEFGKQVACLVELKARFDEEENILLAKKMEKAGVHVVYGMEGLKTHTKTALVVREENGRAQCYAHIGTGNYHYHTARLYTDLGILTCKPDLTRDVARLFNFLTGRNYTNDYSKLLVAPGTMKPRFLEMIEREAEHHRAGRPARIVAKMNQLEDRDVCNALYEASGAGLPIDLIVRGFCILRPGVPGMSENIRVISVIGRYLEHSRIFYFRNGAPNEVDGEFFIGSADWMHRNLESRVEAVTPIEERRLRSELWCILETHLKDRRSAWDMRNDGSYVQRRPEIDDNQPENTGSHRILMERARRRG